MCTRTCLVAPMASKYENVNLLQVSNLTFDPCLKASSDHRTKTTIHLLYIGPLAWNSYHERMNYASFSLFNYTKALISDKTHGFCILLSTEVVP